MIQLSFAVLVAVAALMSTALSTPIAVAKPLDSRSPTTESVMRSLLTDLSTATHVVWDTKACDGHSMTQAHIAAVTDLPSHFTATTTSDAQPPPVDGHAHDAAAAANCSTRSNVNDSVGRIHTRESTTTAVTPGYVAATAWPTGIRLLSSTDLITFVPTGVLAVENGAASPHLASVTGRGLDGSQWWVLVFEAGDGVGVALFTSTTDLLAGVAARIVLCPMMPLMPAGGESPVTPTRYSSPNVYSAVYSQRGGRQTVDVVMGVAWTDADGQSHPANTLVDALSPDEWTAPVSRAIYRYDGRGYGDNPFAGPVMWESKMRKAITNFSYSGSSSAYVPCGTGCGDPRDLSGGNADGVAGAIKISVIGGSGTDGSSRLLLWGWDPIVKVAWLWPSGFGTNQGGFNRSASELTLMNVTLANRPDPKIAVVPCPQNGTLMPVSYQNATRPSLCLWVAVSVAQPHDARLSFVKVLDTQPPPVRPQFSPRFLTSIPPVPMYSATAGTQSDGKGGSVSGATRRHDVASETTRAGLVLRNSVFEVVVASDGASFTVAPLGVGQDGRPRLFNSTFAVVMSSSDPELSDIVDGKGKANTGSSLYSIADDIPSFWGGKRTANPFVAGDKTTRVTATACSAHNASSIALSFTPSSGATFSFEALLSLPEGIALPRLQWVLTTGEKGFFSAAFVGAPAALSNTTLGFPQAANCFNQAQDPKPTSRCPLNESAVVPDAGANLPYAMISIADNNDTTARGNVGTNVALIVDPASSIPFEPCVPWPNHPKAFSGQCPTHTCGDNAASDACQNRGWASEARSSLGVREGALARPLVWAPVFGGFGSEMARLDKFSFTVQLLVHVGTPSETYRKLATEVYGFRDERDNSGPGSLNAALERMSDYLADADGNNFQQWDAVQKYSFYWMDQPCAFKPLDFMSALSISLLTDDDRMYVLFARETAKFGLSRSDKDHYLWPYMPTVGIYKPGSQIHLGMAQNRGGGFATAAEALQIFRLTGGQSPAIEQFAQDTGFNVSLPCPNADHAYDMLTFFESSTDSVAKQWWWNCTMTIAMALLRDNHGVPRAASEQTCVNTDFFLSMFNYTGDASFKLAAQQSEANCESSYQVFPRATSVDGDVVTVDKGNESLSYWWTHGRWGNWGWPGGEFPMWAHEKTVPTWRASHNGIRVSGGGGGGGWLGTISLDSPVRMLRVATLSNDSYARALARASIVGRFGHFPGDFQSKPGHTLLWEAPDLADHILPKETQTTWNTGHFWPIAGVVLDFLMTDAADRSTNAIVFPSTFVSAIPFGRLYSPALGHGRIYGDTALPWIPSGLFTTVSNAQVNWIAAYSDTAVYIVLLSQSFNDESVSCVLNPALVGGLDSPDGVQADVWIDNITSASKVVVANGTFHVTVSPKGITVLKLAGAVARTRLHHRVLAPALPPLSHTQSRVVSDTRGPFGIVSGFVLRWGANLTELYAFSQANSTLWGEFVAVDKTATSHIVFDSVTLHWRIDNGVEQSLVTTTFPFDITAPLPDDCGKVSFYFTGMTSSGTTETTDPMTVTVTG